MNNHLDYCPSNFISRNCCRRAEPKQNIEAFELSSRSVSATRTARWGSLSVLVSVFCHVVHHSLWRSLKNDDKSYLDRAKEVTVNFEPKKARYVLFWIAR